MENNNVIIGDLIKSWQSGKCMNVTLCVTENCNLACTYCYMIHKNNKREMEYSTAKEIVNFVLTNEEYLKLDAIVFDFIGGEPLLKIDLIENICDYIVEYMYINNHKWFDKYRFMITTNGLLYGDERVQRFINKHMGHISLTISIDGTKEKQNISRIKRDGSGSYDDVVKNVPLWLKQFPTAFAKSTFAHDDLVYLKDSIVHLWALGIKNVMANIVYEDVWKPGDDSIFEEQLNLLSDYIIENDLWDKYSVRFFNPSVGLPISEINRKRNVCGAGVKTVAFDCEGHIYPCIRFLDFCMNGGENKSIGTIYNGIDANKLKAFSSLTVSHCMDTKCQECEVSQSCDFCTAFNYISSKNHTIFLRTTYNCLMHKANVRANNRLWYKYSLITQSTSPRTKIKLANCGNDTLKYLKIILSDTQSSHCSYSNFRRDGAIMSDNIINMAIDFCYKHFLIPIFIGQQRVNLNPANNIMFRISDGSGPACPNVYVYDENNIDIKSKSVIVTINRKEIEKLVSHILNISKYAERINVFIQDLAEWTDEDVMRYSAVLDKAIEMLNNMKKHPTINILKREEQRCGAGVTSITLAPNGNFYLCPAFYFNNMDDYAIGNIFDESFQYKTILNIKSDHFFQENKEHNHVLSSCIYNNCLCTGEMNISSYIVDKLEQLHFDKGIIYASATN